MRIAVRILVYFISAFFVAGMIGWATLAIFYSDLPGVLLRTVLASLFALASIALFVFLPNRKRTIVGFLIIFFLIVAWWLTIPPSNNRDWQEDVAFLPYAAIRNNLITIHNIRNLNYRTETDFDGRYYEKTFDLNALESVDLVAVYWMGDAIAHIMLSFGFGGKDYVAVSIETRKEKNEGYSTIKGFFKQYELIYIVGDERDLIRVRTDYRNPREDVYLYRLGIPLDRARKLFMQYMQQINDMQKKPVWYNTLTTNCTTNIVRHVRAYGGRARYNWKILLSGYAPQYVYEMGGLDTYIPFEELKRLSYINPRANAIGDDAEFSRKIRDGLPRPGR